MVKAVSIFIFSRFDAPVKAVLFALLTVMSTPYTSNAGTLPSFIETKQSHKPIPVNSFIPLTHDIGIRADTIKLKEVKISTSARINVQTLLPSQQISKADFAKYAAFNVADIASNFAGVNIKDYGGIGGLKTVSVRSLGAGHTGVLYDGILLNDAQNGQTDLSKFNLYNLQSVTLYNGQSPNIVQPARTFASASILDIQTLKPRVNLEKLTSVTVGARGGSFGLINPYLQLQQYISSRWSLVLNGNYTGANGRYKYKVDGDGSDTLATRNNSKIRSFQTDGTLYWAKNDSNKFKAQFNYYHSNRGLPGPVIFYNPLSAQQLKNEDFLAQATYERMTQNSFHLVVNSKYAHNYLNYRDPNFLNNSGGLNENYTQHEFYQSVAAGYHLLPNWEVALSSDAVVTNLFSDVYNYQFPLRVNLLNAISTNLSFSKLLIQAALLNNNIADHVKNGTAAQSRSVFTPTVVASFTPFTNPALQLRAFYKDVFRYPTFGEQYYYATVPRRLNPERAKQYNLGATWQKSYHSVLTDIALTGDAYYNYITNKIIYLPTRSPETPSVTNLGKVDIRGLDVNLKARFAPTINWFGTFNVTYTYQNAVDITDRGDSYYLEQIPYTPRHLVTVNGGVSHKELAVYYTANISSSRYYLSNNQPQFYLPGYSVSNASVIYNFRINNNPVMASMEINNIYNTNYVIIRSYPMPGRSYRLSFQITI